MLSSKDRNTDSASTASVAKSPRDTTSRYIRQQPMNLPFIIDPVDLKYLERLAKKQHTEDAQTPFQVAERARHGPACTMPAPYYVPTQSVEKYVDLMVAQILCDFGQMTPDERKHFSRDLPGSKHDVLNQICDVINDWTEFRINSDQLINLLAVTTKVTISDVGGIKRSPILNIPFLNRLAFGSTQLVDPISGLTRALLKRCLPAIYYFTRMIAISKDHKKVGTWEPEGLAAVYDAVTDICDTNYQALLFELGVIPLTETFSNFKEVSKISMIDLIKVLITHKASSDDNKDRSQRKPKTKRDGDKMDDEYDDDNDHDDAHEEEEESEYVAPADDDDDDEISEEALKDEPAGDVSSKEVKAITKPLVTPATSAQKKAVPEKTPDSEDEAVTDTRSPPPPADSDDDSATSRVRKPRRKATQPIRGRPRAVNDEKSKKRGRAEVPSPPEFYTPPTRSRPRPSYAEPPRKKVKKTKKTEETEGDSDVEMNLAPPPAETAN